MYNELLRAAGGQYAAYRYHAAEALGDITRLTAWAKHYTGRTDDLDRRDQEHRSGRGAKLLAAAAQRGIPFQIETIYACPNDRMGEEVEIWLKSYSHAPELCSICRAHAAGEIPPARPTVIYAASVEDVARLAGVRMRKPLAEIRERLISRWQIQADDRHFAQRFGPVPGQRAPMGPPPVG
jgi:predicted GIY-YIG superfamily endonuclease